MPSIDKNEHISDFGKNNIKNNYEQKNYYEQVPKKNVKNEFKGPQKTILLKKIM